MPSDLRERIVVLLDTAAPPIDVESLVRQLAGGTEDAAQQASSVPPLRRRVWAFAGAFAGVLVLVGGALAAGEWLHEPAGPVPGGFGDATTATSTGTSGWWWLTFLVGVVGLGAAAFLVTRRRTKRSMTREEEAMQTLEKRTKQAPQPEVEKLTKQRRWLVIGLAFVLVVSAVAVGWLIAENRSLSSDGEAAVWPAESELTARQQQMLEVVEAYQTAWDNDDLDTLMGLYTPTATHEMGGSISSNADGRIRTNLESWRSLGASTTLGAGLGEHVSYVALGNEVFSISASPSLGFVLSRFVFAPGETPLIEETRIIGFE